MTPLDEILGSGQRERKRMTTTEEIFLKLKSDIIAMKLAPGSKISEAEIAKSFDVSRQPVREAFLRLGELNLVQIIPQKATKICKISHQKLRETRFLRTAIEVEVVRVACRVATVESLAALARNLEKQKGAVKAVDPKLLHDLDYEFHRLICATANCQSAFDSIAENKTHTDRVCGLELADTSGMEGVLEGHMDIFEAIRQGNEDAAVAATRKHLSHLDETLLKASTNHPDLFEA